MPASLHTMPRTNRLLALLLAVLVAAPALAAPPADNGGGQKHERKAKKALDDRADTRMRSSEVGKGTHMARKPTQPGAYFDDGNRAAVRSYYAAHPPRSCPPGLAKKNRNCLPPGQAKQWQIGERLPATVVVSAVPSAIRVKLPRVPPGHKYVQVAGDILLVAIGSKMVVDGIAGLTR